MERGAGKPEKRDTCTVRTYAPPNLCYVTLTPPQTHRNRHCTNPSTSQPRRTAQHPLLRQRATARWVDRGCYDPTTALDSARMPARPTSRLQSHERLLVGWIMAQMVPTMPPLLMTRRATVLSPSPGYPLFPSSVQAQTRAQLDQEPNSSENDDTTATYTNTMFDRFMMASPVPLGEASEEERRSSYLGPGDAPLPAPIRGVVYACQPEFDPDGGYILEHELGSPDKTNEAMLFFGTLPLLGACVHTNITFLTLI